MHALSFCKHWPKGFEEKCKLWRFAKQFPTRYELKLRSVTHSPTYVAVNNGSASRNFLVIILSNIHKQYAVHVI